MPTDAALRAAKKISHWLAEGTIDNDFIEIAEDIDREMRYLRIEEAIQVCRDNGYTVTDPQE